MTIFADTSKLEKDSLVVKLEATPWSVKSATYWHNQYQLMFEKYHKQMSENSKQAEHIREL